MARLYRIHEFAELAGVTVKALRHYDRLGLLKPKRTSNGYRNYTERDLERLEEIMALKLLGLPLMQIKAVLNRPALELPDTLRRQRVALEEKQRLTSRVIRAIRMAEETIGRAAKPPIMKRIIEVIGMINDIEVMKKYYGTEAAWEKHRRLYEDGPSRQWRELYQDVNSMLHEDPGTDVAQKLADRWLRLSLDAYRGDPENPIDSAGAWFDRNNWPASIKRRIDEFNLEEVHKFISRAALSARKKYFSEEAWQKALELRKDPVRLTVIWQSQVDLFREIRSCMRVEWSDQQRDDIVTLWMRHLDTASGGDPEVKAGFIRAWADRRNWSATLRYIEEGLAMTTGEEFDRVADFIEKAVSPAQEAS